MTNNIIIKVHEVLGKSVAVSSDDAQKLYVIFKSSIEEKHPINVSFQNIDTILTAFLNRAYGELFRDYSETEILKYIKFIDINDSTDIKIKLVKEHAIDFYDSKQ